MSIPEIQPHIPSGQPDDIVPVLQGIFNLLDESIGRNEFSSHIKYRSHYEGSTQGGIQTQLRNRLILFKRTLSEVETALIGAEKALALFPGSEVITDPISSMVRSIISQKHESHDRAPSPTFLDEFGKSIGRLEHALGILGKQIPTAARSAEETVSAYISCLYITRKLCENLSTNVRWLDFISLTNPDSVFDSDESKQLADSNSSMLSLIIALQDIIFATDRFSLSAAPYLGDRRRSMKDDFLTVAAISALFCAMPVDLISLSQGLPDESSQVLKRAIVPFLAYLSTTLCTAAFISAFLIARFLDGEMSLSLDLSQNLTLRWTLYYPVVFLATGALSFFGGFTIVVGMWGMPRLWALILVIMAFVGVVAGLVWVIWNLHRRPSKGYQKMSLA